MIFQFVYNFFLFLLFIFISPKLIKEFLFQRKHRKIGSRIFPKTPKNHKQNVIWLHAVSLGEIKALSTLIPHIRRTNPQSYIFITTVTATGYKEAKQFLHKGDHVAYLPLDFSWVINPFVKKIKPQLLILVEGDYWKNLMKAVKNQGGTVVVVSGKMSVKSMQRYRLFYPFSKELFSYVDHFFLQSKTYLKRFTNIGISEKKISVTGNLKFDIPSPKIERLKEFKEELNIKSGDSIITIGSTHEGEEKLLLNTIKEILKKYHNLKVLILPRHPERFNLVKNLTKSIPNITVVDKMGVLSLCYYLSELAIVGGSFIKGIGGHDIFEPIKLGIPTLFGPFMYKQLDLVELITKSGAGKTVNIDDLLTEIETLLSNDNQKAKMAKNGILCAQKSIGSAKKSWEEINIFLESRGKVICRDESLSVKE